MDCYFLWKGAGEVEYSELGCSTSRSKMELVKTHGAEHNNNIETEDSQAGKELQ